MLKTLLLAVVQMHRQVWYHIQAKTKSLEGKTKVVNTHTKKKKKRQKTQVKLCLFPLAPSFFFFKGIKRKDSFVFAMASSTPQQQAVFDFALVNEQGESFAIGFDVAKPDPSFVGERFVHLGTSPTQRTVSISAIL
jgi:hypothetical protein